MSDPLIDRQLGDYKIIDLLGQGGMARIYRGYDSRLDRYAAIKVIDSALAASQDAEEYRERFQREARAIARLHHPNIVNIYQFGEIDATYYMAMAFLEGKDLRWLLKEYAERDEKMPPGEVFRIIRDIASALDYAHQQGVIHRDIKPSNIMVTPGGSAVLMDFGLALHVPEGTTGNIFGTAHYIAPEQAVSSANAVPQSDMYSLGIVLYEMLVGQVPFDDPSAMSVALKHLNEPPPPPRRFNPDISEAVEAVVLRSLQKEPEDRYPNGATMMRALEVAMEYKDEDATLKDPPPLPRVPKGPPPELKLETSSSPSASSILTTRSNLPWIAGVAGVAVLLIAALIFINSGSPQVNVVATQTAAVLAAVTDEPSAAPPSTDVPTDAPVVENTIAPSATTIPATDAPTDAVIDSTASAPTTPPTEVPTTVPTTVPLTADNADFSLLYDLDTLLLLNQSGATVDVSGLTFVQQTSGGRELTFSTDRWDGGSRPPSALPAGDCFQVWTTDFTTRPKPAACDTRHAQAQAGPQSWFWINDDPDATFEVVRRRSGRADQVLATCTIGAGECFVSLGGSRIASVPTEVQPTDAPTTAVPTQTPTERPSATATPAADTAVVLIYDSETLVLLNRSNGDVDVSGLTFVQTTAAGRELSFGTERWDGGSRPTWALPAGDCFEVWPDTITDTLPAPDYCGDRHSWRSVGPTRRFWISDDPQATFEVRRDDEVLVVCEISAGECGFDVE